MIGLIIGFLIGSALLSALLYVSVLRVRKRQTAEFDQQAIKIEELRKERAEDKETNRLLRHQLHTASAHKNGSAAVSYDQDDADALLSERDGARQELVDAQMQLEDLQVRLTDREAKLGEYRSALKEIRLSLEAQDRLRGIITITEDVPANVRVAGD